MAFFDFLNGVSMLPNTSRSQYVDQVNRGGTVNITNDTGGYYSEYAAATDRLMRSGATVNVKGVCKSACTLALASPNLHVSPGATFGFHGAYNPQTGAQDPATTQDLLSRMPTKVRALIASKGTIPDGYYGSPHLTITGAELIAMGYPRIGENRSGPIQTAARPVAAPVVAQQQPVAASFEPSSFFRGIAEGWHRFWASIFG